MHSMSHCVLGPYDNLQMDLCVFSKAITGVKMWFYGTA